MLASKPKPFRVLDFSTHVAGPLTSSLLVGLGADVIKVENPKTGDGNRRVPSAPTIHGDGIFHVALNGGTRSLAVHKNSARWPELVAAGATWADVVIVGARPADAAALGIDEESLRVHNSKIVYCEITGYGTSGPWHDRPAHGQNPDALAGLIDVEWEDGLPSAARWLPSGTSAAGVHAALGIMDALYCREISGAGQHVAVSLWGSAMWWNWRTLTSQANLGEPWVQEQSGSRYNLYSTADDKVIMVAPIEEKFWDAFCSAIGIEQKYRDRGDWTDRYEFGRGPEFDHERRAIQECMRTETLDVWDERFRAADIPACPVLSAEEAIQTDHAQSVGVLARTTVRGQEARLVRFPIERAQDGVTVRPTSDVGPAPLLGEHSSEIVTEFGLEATVDELVNPAPASREPLRTSD